MPVINELLEPVRTGGRSSRGALPLAERLGLTMCPEIHIPSNLKGKMVGEYVDFIQETGTRSFALNIDFSVSRTKFEEGEWRDPAFTPNVPEDLIPLLPYVACCHAKCFHVDEDSRRPTCPTGRF